MVMPVSQECSQCGQPFLGSDCIGGLCPRCESGGVFSEETLHVIELSKAVTEVIKAARRVVRLYSEQLLAMPPYDSLAVNGLKEALDKLKELSDVHSDAKD